MRVIKSLLLVVLTLALMAVGALLPYGAAMAQDRQLESGADTRELNDVQILIQQDMSTAQVLSLLAGEYTRVEWDSETNLTEKEVLSYTYNWTELMVLEELLPESAVHFADVDDSYTFLWTGNAEANPFLAISSENREALLLWECTWESLEDGSVYTMWIDDTTGMMYGINRTSNADYVNVVISEKYLNQYMEQLDQYVDRWVFFLCSYYDCEVVSGEFQTQENSGSEINDTYILTLELEGVEENRNTCTVQLKFQGGGVSFLC